MSNRSTRRRHDSHRGRHVWAHYAMWELENGRIPDGHQVFQTCGEHSCVNPAHLILIDVDDPRSDPHLDEPPYGGRGII